MTKRQMAITDTLKCLSDFILFVSIVTYSQFLLPSASRGFCIRIISYGAQVVM